MIIKYIVLPLLTGLVCVGCMDKKSADFKNEQAIRVAAVQTLVDYEVPVQEGMATIVKLDEDTLAVTRTGGTILVPRYAVASGELKITYSADAIYENYASSEYWHYLAFEDSRMADYDYNDLVIHCRIVNSGVGFQDGKILQKHVVSVQPIALGGARKLRLGILYKDNAAATQLKEVILCEDVRTELFDGNPSFPINTDRSKEIKQVSRKLSPLFEIENFDRNFKVVWFIETETDRLYAATTNFGAERDYDMLSTDGLPYGLSLTKKWDYPIEKCPIQEVYPNFEEWIRSGNEAQMLMNPNKSKQFPASLHRLWDYDK